jgi:3-methyladenine DNA glycosylase AlkC
VPKKQETTPQPESGLWKDHLGRAGITKLAEKFAKSHSKFEPKRFVADALSGDYEKLELKDRISRLAQVLRKHLPQDYAKAISIIVKAAPTFDGFGTWVLTSYVEQFGLEDFEVSVGALKELTKYGSSEFAIRPYIIRYQDRMLPILHSWAEDANEHVRRLAAEGSRPRGVWTQHITAFRKDPRPVIELLDCLKADQSLYVRKAVANNLNDISKDHPDLAIETALKWKKSGNPHTDWIVKHACRTLIKSGDQRVFPILGYDRQPKLKVASFSLSPKKCKIGASVRLECRLESSSRASQRLVIDYRVHFARPKGRAANKVFKWTEKTLPPDGVLDLTTRHKFVDGSTRTHHPGVHKIELMVNGKVLASATCTLAR